MSLVSVRGLRHWTVAYVIIYERNASIKSSITIGNATGPIGR